MGSTPVNGTACKLRLYFAGTSEIQLLNRIGKTATVPKSRMFAKRSKQKEPVVSKLCPCVGQHACQHRPAAVFSAVSPMFAM